MSALELRRFMVKNNILTTSLWYLIQQLFEEIHSWKDIRCITNKRAVCLLCFNVLLLLSICLLGVTRNVQNWQPKLYMLWVFYLAFPVFVNKIQHRKLDNNTFALLFLHLCCTCIKKLFIPKKFLLPFILLPLALVSKHWIFWILILKKELIFN